MVPYPATDVLRVMQYELSPELTRTYGNQFSSDVSVDDDRDDDRHSDSGGRGKLIRLIASRNPAPAAA